MLETLEFFSACDGLVLACVRALLVKNTKGRVVLKEAGSSISCIYRYM